MIDGCEGPREPVNVTIENVDDPIITAFGANPADVCATATGFYLEVFNAENYKDFQWYRNGVSLPHGSNNSRLYPTLENGITPGTYRYSVRAKGKDCNTLLPEVEFLADVVIKSATITPSISIVKPFPSVVRFGKSLTLTTVTQFEGSNPAYQWYSNETEVGTGLPNYTVSSTLGDGNYIIYCKMVVESSSNHCVTQSEVTSAPVQIEVNTKLNYIETKNYDENNQVIASGRTYFDDDGQLLQEQTKVFSGTTQVLATMPLKDRYDRAVIHTLPAPLNQAGFEYKPGFVQEPGGEAYNHTHFDGKPVPGDINIGTPGTLGWYYSDNNTLEDHVPVTSYPYTRVEYYEDGTGDPKRSSGPGEALRMGSGHEVYTRTFGVSSELDHYVSVRDRILGIMGNGTPRTLAKEAVQSVTIDANGYMAVSFMDRSGNVLMTARSGDWLQPNDDAFSLEDGTGSIYLLSPGPLVANNSLEIIDVTTNTPVYNGAGDAIPTLSAGFYTINNGGTDLSVAPSHGFGDVSYNIYDNAGRLVVSISPRGVQEIIGYDIANYTSEELKSLPFATHYEYNHQGWLLSTRETDAGTTRFLYRKDGSIRYSQNAKQEQEKAFSYTDYDALGRPIESGELDLDGTGAFNFPELETKIDETSEYLLAFYDAKADLSAAKKDWTRTHYDTPGNAPAITGEPQDFVLGAVSRTENEHITTWYSYDEQGRVVWMAQKPKAPGMNYIFLLEYSYDFLGNVLQVGFKSYHNTIPHDEFYHYYTYDADKRLSSVYTSLEGGLAPSTLDSDQAAKLQARYMYYLHGPLKRIELGGNLQGIDFVYNINGWLKQVNHPSLDPLDDPGGDGNNGFSKDAFGLILNYYERDMNNLFGVTTATNRPDPLEFHGLEEGAAPVRLAGLFDVLRPGAIGNFGNIKKYSAENPVYIKQLKAFKASIPPTKGSFTSKATPNR